MPALPSIEKLVAEIESDDTAVKARCEVALQLARKLDDAVDDTAPASFTATAAISKELRSVIDDLSSVEGKKQSFLADVFGE